MQFQHFFQYLVRPGIQVLAQESMLESRWELSPAHRYLLAQGHHVRIARVGSGKHIGKHSLSYSDVRISFKPLVSGNHKFTLKKKRNRKRKTKHWQLLHLTTMTPNQCGNTGNQHRMMAQRSAPQSQISALLCDLYQIELPHYASVYSSCNEYNKNACSKLGTKLCIMHKIKTIHSIY